MAAYDVSLLGSGLEFDTTSYLQGALGKLSATRFVIAWQQSDIVKNVQCFDINTSTGAITAVSSPLNFLTDSVVWGNTLRPALQVYDSTHFVIAWNGLSSDGFIQSFQVNAGTGAITTWGSALEFDATNGTGLSMCAIDSSHYLVTWSGAANDGFARVFTLNTGTGAIAGEGANFEWQTTEATITSVALLDSGHAIVCLKHETDNDLSAKVLSIDGSYNVGNAGTETVLQATITVNGNNVVVMDSSISPMVAVDFYSTTTGTTSGKILRQIQVNTSTWAVSNLGTQSQVTSSSNVIDSCGYAIQKIDSTHFIVWYKGSADDDGYATTYSINTSDGSLSALSTVEYLNADVAYHSSLQMDTYLYVCAYQDVTSGDGFVQAFSIAQPVTIKPFTLLGVG